MSIKSNSHVCETYFVSPSEFPYTGWQQSWRTWGPRCLSQVLPLAAEASMPLIETLPANHLQVSERSCLCPAALHLNLTWSNFFFSTNTAKARTISSHQIRYDRSSVRNYVQLALLWWVTKEAIRSFKSLACKLLPMKIIRLYYIPQHLLHDSFLRVFTYFDWKLNYIISYFRHHMMCIKLILNNNLVLL